jgi:hypothetical protein
MIRLFPGRALAMGLLLVLFPFAPLQQRGDAKTPKQVCKDRCVTEYHFCLNRSLTAKGRADCKAGRKACKNGCGK